MKNLVSNWIFTLIETVLLAVFAVLMLTVGDSILNVLVGVALIVYIALIVLSKVVTYRGVIQMIALLEFFVVTVLAVFVIVDFMPLATVDSVNFTVGVTMWFRATTEILHSWHGQGEGRVQKKTFSAWKIFFYILLVTFGTFIASTSLFDDTLIKYFIAGVSIAGTVIMGVLTYTNYRDYRAIHPKPIKQKVAKKPVAELADSKNGDKALGEADSAKKTKGEAGVKELPAASDTKQEASSEEYIAPEKK
ncbi:MAG: hypothetical protein IKB51_07030 [Clostridia bacterium]|nr:hypothetical protein [Clostridia bacterium]